MFLIDIEIKYLTGRSVVGFEAERNSKNDGLIVGRRPGVEARCGQ